MEHQVLVGAVDLARVSGGAGLPAVARVEEDEDVAGPHLGGQTAKARGDVGSRGLRVGEQHLTARVEQAPVA